uniref:Uncharacterized protein n=1 Tax=Chromera velia CCMP2878 TaxID=1169474 RepID=A0A0G4H7H9_9ALVE|eukprot:Cvel_25032.t1-p1 / transcript=Cvel_25032.t1 / gene=Cvel_25032 / organism=Chromera_velia_CCMP2878 / gene_product=hypothetical protein / transcript_product=hypothetical protein / location=Cvel_scaffold2778:15589-15879(-) / protein_length=97 / sequence_SO=supercontig / SO=protein_coding / is_pseudo=false
MTPAANSGAEWALVIREVEVCLRLEGANSPCGSSCCMGSSIRYRLQRSQMHEDLVSPEAFPYPFVAGLPKSSLWSWTWAFPASVVANCGFLMIPSDL